MATQDKPHISLVVIGHVDAGEFYIEEILKQRARRINVCNANSLSLLLRCIIQGNRQRLVT